MWIWDQSEGRLYRQVGTANVEGDKVERVFVSAGYSGKAWAKNNPGAESKVAMGPIPRGFWNIIRNYDSPNVGPFAIELQPQPGTRTYGRSAFRIHGDSIAHPGDASHGCIILPRSVREQIMKTSDRVLRVVE